MTTFIEVNEFLSLPGWQSGLQVEHNNARIMKMSVGLESLCPSGLVGSNPTPGVIFI